MQPPTKDITSLKISEQIHVDIKTTNIQQQQRFPAFVVVLVLFELFYLLIVALSPLPQLGLSNTPIAQTWAWTLVPSQLLRSMLGSPLSHTWLAPTLLGLTFLGLFVTYGYGILSVGTKIGFVWGRERNELKPLQQGPNQQRWLYMLLGGTLLFSLTLLVQPMLFSDDVFTYIFSGRILTLYHADPFNTAPMQFPTDPFLRWVVAGHDAPNLYGPLWYYISSLLVSIGSNHQIGTLLLFKGIATLAHLINVVLVWSILSHIAPQRRILGTLLYAWNPLILVELAGSGHSEGVLLFLLFLGTWLYLVQEEHWIRWSAFLVFGLALSMNLIVALCLPLLLWFDVRSEQRIARAIGGFCWRAVLVLLPALAIWLPFWRGETTFFALTSAIDMQHFIHSPIGILVRPTHAFFRLIAYVLHFPPSWDPISSADVALRGSATFIFVLIYANAFGLVRQAPTSSTYQFIASFSAAENVGERVKPRRDQFIASSSPNLNVVQNNVGFDVLLYAWNVAVFAYLMLVSGWFWPWYLLWVLWIAVLRRFDALTSTMLVLSGTVLLFYLFIGLLRAPAALYSSTLIFGLPLVYLIGVRGRQKQKERTKIVHDGRSETA